ncbi:MAG: hypothetical protein Q9192_006145 [Flavoplaca navasiana]
MDLPPEVLDTIIELLPKTDKANLAAVCKAFKAYVERKIWSKIRMRIGTPWDTAGLVGLLTVRPDIIPMIRTLVLDEYHPCHTRRLLSIKMPEMHCILILHAGEPIKHASEREKRALNRSLVRQPKLTNREYCCRLKVVFLAFHSTSPELNVGVVVFWVENVDPTQYRLSREDAALFRQPTVQRFRLHHVDFSAFENIDKTYLIHTNLQIWDLEDSQYTPKALNRFIFPTHNLTQLRIQHYGDPAYIPSRYLPTLIHCAATLKNLKLEWANTRSYRTPTYEGLDLTSFSALRLLRIQPFVLLGHGGGGLESYVAGTDTSIAELIRTRLPRGLKILLLDGLTSPPSPELRMFLFPMDQELIRCLIEHRQSLAPRLRYINLYYLEEMVEPTELYDLATKHSIDMSALCVTDHIDPDVRSLDEDTFVARNGELMSW